MEGTVLGIGPGTILLFVVWSLTVLICFITTQYKGLVRSLVVLIATIFSSVLLSLPRGSPSIEEPGLIDSVFILRTTFVILLGVSCILGGVLVTLLHWSTPVYAKSLKKNI